MAKASGGRKRGQAAPPAAKRGNKKKDDDELEEHPDVDLSDQPGHEEEEEDGADEPKPRRREPTAGRPKESKLSIAARKARLEPEDVEKDKKRKKVKVDLIATRLGFDGVKRVREGAKFSMKCPLDDDGHVILPTWAVFPEDYVPAEPVQLPPGMKPKVRGGATVGGVKPNL